MIKPYKITQIIRRRNDRCGAEEGRAAQVTKINQLGHLSNDYNYICPQSFFYLYFRFILCLAQDSFSVHTIITLFIHPCLSSTTENNLDLIVLVPSALITNRMPTEL